MNCGIRTTVITMVELMKVLLIFIKSRSSKSDKGFTAFWKNPDFNYIDKTLSRILNNRQLIGRIFDVTPILTPKNLLTVRKLSNAEFQKLRKIGVFQHNA